MANYRTSGFGVALLLLGVFTVVSSAAAGAVHPSTTYTVTFHELGIPTGTNWSINFGGTTYYSTGASLNITGLSATSYYYYPTATITGATSNTEYTTATSAAYMSVPAQTSQYLVYVAQYKITFADSPAAGGSTSPSYPTFYPAGSVVAISALPALGYHFGSWKFSTSKDLLDNASAVATAFTVNAPGTLTARFTAHSLPVVFDETGLPAGTSWTALFAGTSFGSSTSTITTSFHRAGGYSFSVPTVFGSHGVEYVPYPSSGGITQPSQPSQEIVFTKEFQLTFVTSPATSGSIYPSTTSYYPNGTQLVLTAYGTSSYLFSSWTASNTGVTILNKSSASTVASIAGSATITAKFVAGSPCTANCSVNFTETGLPSGTSWGATIGGLVYLTTGPTLNLPKVSTSLSWTVAYPIAGAGGLVQFDPTQSSGSVPIGSLTTQAIQFVQYDQESFVMSTPSTTGATLGTGWYPNGTTWPISVGFGPALAFNTWSANDTAVVFGPLHSTSTSIFFSGPATVTAKFKPVVATATIEAFGLPKGTVWGVSINGLLYQGKGHELNVTLPSASFTFYVINSLAGKTAGTQYYASVTTGSLSMPQQLMAAVVYTTYYSVALVAGGTSGGTVGPSGTAWYSAGSVLAIEATNGTSVSFVSWSSTTTTGTLPLAHSTSPSTTVTINGAGTITAKFA